VRAPEALVLMPVEEYALVGKIVMTMLWFGLPSLTASTLKQTDHLLYFRESVLV
jgi:hypothetical protein